jgi:hypothetical protein
MCGVNYLQILTAPTKARYHYVFVGIARICESFTRHGMTIMKTINAQEATIIHNY